MRDNILATDLQHHFDILPALRNIAERKLVLVKLILNVIFCIYDALLKILLSLTVFYLSYVTESIN